MNNQNLALLESVSPSLMGRIRQGIFGIDPRETLLEVRGFEGGPPACREGLEGAGGHFVLGYHLALQISHPETLVRTLKEISADYQGFAFEGAGMGIYLRQYFAPWSNLVDDFCALADDHIYMVHVGMGWAMPRLPFQSERSLKSHHPLYKWLSLDGWGFHDGYFHPQRTLIERRRPNQIAGYALRGYDQGVGRVLWFASCGQVDKVIEAIQSFSNTRHNDLWGGIGLACAYAGGVPIEELRPLFDAAGEEAPALLQGICFAVTARYRAGNVLPHTEEIAAAFLNMTPGEAAALSDRLEKNLPEDQAVEAYEIWRQRLQNEFGPSSGP